MADVQIENGYTKLANELQDAIQCFKFNLNEMKVMNGILRYTYGFSRKSHQMSLTFFMNYTNLTRSRVNDSLKSLEENNVIFVKKHGDSYKPNIYTFNKNYDTWKVEKYKNCKLTSYQDDTSVQDDTSTQFNTSTSVQDDTSTSVQDDTKEIKDLNKSLNKEEEGVANEQLIRDKYIQRRARGYYTTAEDDVHIKKIVQMAIPIDFVLNSIDNAFDNYKAGHSYDRIRSFHFCAVCIADDWTRHNKVVEVKSWSKNQSSNEEAYKKFLEG